MRIEGIVLAAGYSTRAGTFKMALDIGGKTVLQHCVEGLLPVCSRVIVVGGYEIEEVARIVEGYSDVDLVFNQRFAQGMFTSVKEGLQRITGDRFFLTPGDYPLVTPEICLRILTEAGDIIVPTYKGRKGHPVLMRGDLAQEVLKEDDNYNLRSFIQRKGFQTLEVDDEGVLMDIDTPDDYRQVMERIAERRGFGETQ